MNCNHTTCPLCRLENVTMRLEAVLAALGVPSFAGIYSTPAADSTPPDSGLSALDPLLAMSPGEGCELDALHQQEQELQEEYHKRVDAWNLRERAVQVHCEGGR